jgi:hypothetical protein
MAEPPALVREVGVVHVGAVEAELGQLGVLAEEEQVVPEPLGGEAGQGDAGHGRPHVAPPARQEAALADGLPRVQGPQDAVQEVVGERA